ncbi:MAG: TIGR01777 family protein [Lewinellaceae bacterium]|nr:TIGR01777 family protein [Lewinellaceae bacterium]
MATVLLAGGTGLIGRRLSAKLTEKGYSVLHLSRSASSTAEYPTYRWDLAKRFVDPEAIQRADYVINLAGAGIADKPWTAARKQVIIDSRVQGNELLAASFKQYGAPKAYLSGAAIGYYGDRPGDQWLKEDALPGAKGFLPESCLAWEKAIRQVANVGVHTLGFRIGIVLTPEGGALQKMLLPLKFHLSPYFGTGQQWYSWIHLDDICAIFMHGLEHPQMEGMYNAVAPNPVRNIDLARELARVIPGKQYLIPAPGFALRLALGEMADTVLSGSRVSADRIQESGFTFQFPELPGALENLLPSTKR